MLRWNRLRLGVWGNEFGARVLARAAQACIFIVATACHRDSVAPCPSDLTLDLSPRTAALVVGGRVTPTLQLWTCAHTQIVQTSFTLVPTDTMVVKVDSVGRRLNAVAPGTTAVTVNSSTNGNVGYLTVTVSQ